MASFSSFYELWKIVQNFSTFFLKKEKVMALNFENNKKKLRWIFVNYRKTRLKGEKEWLVFEYDQFLSLLLLFLKFSVKMFAFEKI